MVDERVDIEFNVKDTGEIKRISREYVDLIRQIRKGMEDISGSNAASARIWSKFNKEVTSNLSAVQKKLKEFADSGGDVDALTMHFEKVNKTLRELQGSLRVGALSGVPEWRGAMSAASDYRDEVSKLIAKMKSFGRTATGSDSGASAGGGVFGGVFKGVLAGEGAIKAVELAFEGLKKAVEAYAETTEHIKRVEIATHATSRQVSDLTHTFMNLHAHTGATLESLTETFIHFKEQSGLAHEEAGEAFKSVVLEADKAGVSVGAFSDIAVNAIRRFGLSAKDIPATLAGIRSQLGPLAGTFAQEFPHISMVFKDLNIGAKDTKEQVAALTVLFKELAEHTGQPAIAMQQLSRIISQMGDPKTPLGRRMAGDLEEIRKAGGGVTETLTALREHLAEIFKLADSHSAAGRTVLDSLGFTSPESREVLRALIKSLGEHFPDAVKKFKTELSKADIENTFSRQLSRLSGNAFSAAAGIGALVDKVLGLTTILTTLNNALEALGEGKGLKVLKDLGNMSFKFSLGGLMLQQGSSLYNRFFGSGAPPASTFNERFHFPATPPSGGAHTGNLHHKTSYGGTADARAKDERLYLASFRHSGRRGAAFTPGAGEAAWPGIAQVPPGGSGPYGWGSGGGRVMQASYAPGGGLGGYGGGYGGRGGSPFRYAPFSGGRGRGRGGSYGGGQGGVGDTAAPPAWSVGAHAGLGSGTARAGGGGLGRGRTMDGGIGAHGDTPPISVGSGGLSTLAADRARFRRELDSNPALRAKVLKLAANEQNDHPQGAQAVIESLMNRASYQGTSLARQATWTSEGGYYADKLDHHRRAEGVYANPKKRANLEAALQRALGGSNIANFASDNASGDFARGRIRRKMFNYAALHHGEYFVTPGWGPGPVNQRKYAAWRKRMESGRPINADGSPNYAGSMGARAGGPAIGGQAVSSHSAGYKSDMAFLRARGGHDARDDPNSKGGLTPEMAARLRAAGADYEAQTGQKANYGEMFRDMARQRRYYNSYIHGGGGLAAPPGRSRHQSGTATDIPRGAFRNWLAKGRAGKYGLEFLKGHAYRVDPVHVQMNRGDRRVFARPDAPSHEAKATLPDADKFRKKLEKPIKLKIEHDVGASAGAKGSTSIRHNFPNARQRRRQSATGSAKHAHRHGYHDAGPTSLT